MTRTIGELVLVLGFSAVTSVCAIAITVSMAIRTHGDVTLLRAEGIGNGRMLIAKSERKLAFARLTKAILGAVLSGILIAIGFRYTRTDTVEPIWTLLVATVAAIDLTVCYASIVAARIRSELLNHDQHPAMLDRRRRKTD